MGKFQNEFKFYDLVCDIFTANYSCLYVANQEMPIFGNQLKFAHDGFNKDTTLLSAGRKEWLEEKIKKILLYNLKRRLL